MRKKILFLLSMITLVSCGSTSSDAASTSLNTGESTTTNTQKISSDAVDSLKSSLLISGTEKLLGETKIERTIEVVFNTNAYYFKEVTDTITNINSLLKIDDECYYKNLGKNNVEITIPFPDGYEWVYDNPFVNLVASDFESSLDNNFILNTKKAQKILPLLTNYNDTVTSFKVAVTNDKVSEIYIQSYNNYGESFSYNFIVTLHGQAQIPNLSYSRDTHTDDLEFAFESLGNNYTIEAVNHEDNSQDVVSMIYRDESIIYNDNSEVRSGIIFHSGVPFRFSVNEEDVALIGNIYDNFYPQYLLNLDISGAFFSYDVDDDIYRIKDRNALSIIGMNLGYDENTSKEFLYFAVDAEIKLNNSELDFITVTTNVYDSIFTTTFTFSNIGTTVLPIDIIPMINGQFTGWSYEQYLDISNFMGVENVIPYISLKNIEITSGSTLELSGFYDEENVIAHYSSLLEDIGYVLQDSTNTNYGKSMTYANDEFQIILNESTLFGLTNFTIEITNLNSDKTIPESFIGVFSGNATKGTFGGDVAIEVVIDEENISINGKNAEILSYSYEDGFVLSVDDKTYILMNMTYDGVFDELFLADENYAFMANISRKMKIPSEFQGSFYGNIDSVTPNDKFLGEATITLVIGEYTAIINGVSCSIDEYDGTYLTMSVDGIAFYICAGYPETTIMFSTMDGNVYANSLTRIS